MSARVDAGASFIQTNPVLRILSLARALMFVLPTFVGCHCSQSSNVEPDKSSDFHPTSADGLAATPPTKAQQMQMTDQEFRDYHIKVANELCGKAFEHINVLNGKPPTDPNPMAKMMLGACYMQGNNAWYKCQLNATTPQDLAVCNERFMRPN
jgi:hypothetical protein